MGGEPCGAELCRGRKRAIPRTPINLKRDLPKPPRGDRVGGVMGGAERSEGYESSLIESFLEKATLMGSHGRMRDAVR